MAKENRQIIKIDEDKCNGCGLCVSACAEGALKIIDGKAKLVSETYCDGLGACLGDCPQDAITIETREAEVFDEAAAMAQLKKDGVSPTARSHSAPQSHSGFVCPSARVIDRTQEARSSTPCGCDSGVPSELRQWPVKLRLVNPQAPYFQDVDLLVAADCAPFAYAALHQDYLRGKTLVIACPKFEEVQAHVDKLSDIIRYGNIRSITVMQMEVPCCSGLLNLTQAAVAASEKQVPLEVATISLAGDLKDRRVV